MSEFSERLSGLIFEHGLNRKLLAKNVGINASCITHYLQDKRIPTVKSLILLAEYFNCSTDFLLGREEENKTLTFKPVLCNFKMPQNNGKLLVKRRTLFKSRFTKCIGKSQKVVGRAVKVFR